IIEILGRVKPPYNINQATQELALTALQEVGQVNDMIKELVQMRDALKEVFEKISFITKVFPSDANFLLVKMKNAKAVYDYLLTRGIVVRDRSNVLLCNECLRITIGTEKDNTILVDALLDYLKESNGK